MHLLMILPRTAGCSAVNDPSNNLDGKTIPETSRKYALTVLRTELNYRS